MREQFRNAFLGIAAFFALLMFGTLGVMLLSVYRSAATFEPVEQHVEYVAALRSLEQDVDALLNRSVPAGARLSPESIAGLRARVAQLQAIDAGLDPDTPDGLRRLDQQIDRLGNGQNIPVQQLVSLLGEMIDAEFSARQFLLRTIMDDLGREKRFVILMAVAIALVMLGSAVLFRQYVTVPARRIADLLAEVGAQRFNVVETAGAPPILRSILDNYNQLVGRLGELEAEQQQRQATLERQVQLTTGSLMRLQGTLANSEKLAVVGEIAAGIAHELRNPLAGIRAALDNFKGELNEPGQQARMNLVIDELKRMTALLNHLLEQAGVTPEPPILLHVKAAIDEVVQLAKLQLADSIRISQEIDHNLCCALPEDRFRQAMLNLILNSGQVIGDRPGRINVQGKHADNRAEIVVSDDGPGFPAELLRSGPQSFFSRRDQGTGLGLAIVQRLARDLGGHLSISNVEPHGARVAMDFPCGASHGG